jgi:hypothetical protein
MNNMGDPVFESSSSVLTLSLQQSSPSSNSKPDNRLVEHERQSTPWIREEDEEIYKLLPPAKCMNADVLNSPKLTRLLEGLSIGPLVFNYDL